MNEILEATAQVFEVDKRDLLGDKKGEILGYANLAAAFIMKHKMNLSGETTSNFSANHFTINRERKFTTLYFREKWFRKHVQEVLIRIGEQEDALNYLICALAG